jgi:hypothetical protein
MSEHDERNKWLDDPGALFPVIFFGIVGFYAALGAGISAVGHWQCKSALKEAGMSEPPGLRCDVSDHRAAIFALLKAEGG